MNAKTLSAIALAASLTSAQSSLTPGSGIEVIEGYNIQASLDSAGEKVTFEIYMKDNSWMGIVIGSSGMSPGSDMIQIKANGVNSRVYDKFSQGYISPAIDKGKDLASTFRFFEGGFIRFTIERALDTGDTARLMSGFMKSMISSPTF